MKEFEEENRIICEDKEKNPQCGYSTSSSTSCRTVNGESKCEKIKRIYRNCPGKPQVSDMTSLLSSSNRHSRLKSIGIKKKQMEVC